MLEEYRNHVAKRATLGIPPIALGTNQTNPLNKQLKALNVEVGIS